VKPANYHVRDKIGSEHPGGALRLSAAEIKTDVVIVGAGPTGLALACQFVRYGIDCVIIEKNEPTLAAFVFFGLYYVLFPPSLDSDCEVFHILISNDPSSATRRTGRNDCNRDAPAGFAAAHG